MIHLLGRSIRHKVTAAILLTSIVSLVMSYAVLLAYEWRSAETDLVNKINVEARIVRENLSAVLAFRAVKEAQKMLAGLEADSEVVAAALYLESGELMASYMRTGADYRLPETAPPRGIVKGRDEIEVTLLVEAGGAPVGWLLLVAGYESRDERYALYLATASGMFLLAIGIAVLLSRFLEERISKPILALVDTTRRVTVERDYSVRVSGADATEVNLLAESFNQMLKEVNQREIQLTQAMDRLRLTLDASKTYAWEWDRTGNRVVWNASESMPPTLAALQGRRPEDLLELVHPQDRAALVEAYASGMASGDEFELEFQLLTEEGPIELACRGKGFRDPSGKLERALGVANDLTQRRQTERALYWREQEFRALVEHSPDMIARYNRDLRVEYVNPACEEHTGMLVEDMQGRTLSEMGVPEERVAIWRIAIERIFNGAGHAEIDFDYKHPEDGQIHSYSAYLVPEFAPSGEVEHVLSVSRDITERKRAEQQLRAAKERAEAAAHAKSVFLANMSHDIRTPLTAILGFAEILRLRGGDAEMREMTEMIKAGGKRLMDTLNSVLDLARLEGGESQLTIEPVNVTHEVSEIIRLFRSNAEEKGLALELDAPDETIWGGIDRAAFNRVLMNILGNALKFTSKGSVSARVWRQDERFFLSVEDTGPGIPKEVISKIFDAFTRSRQSEVRQVEGSGLGMTITRQLVRLMGGQIHVESEVGKGSVFTVSLPSCDAPPLAEEAVEPEAPAAEVEISHRPTILAVEDNPNTVRLLQMMLANRYDLKAVSTGVAAIEWARRRVFEAVLMDISLESSEAGVEYLRRMRAIEPYRSVPIIAFTAHALPGEAERFRRLGFDDFLAKPFTVESLESVIEQALRRAAR